MAHQRPNLTSTQPIYYFFNIHLFGISLGLRHVGIFVAVYETSATMKPGREIVCQFPVQGGTHVPAEDHWTPTSARHLLTKFLKSVPLLPVSLLRIRIGL